MLEEFGPSLYVAEGPTVSFLGFPYPTRMAIARLADGSAWAWSPIALTEDLAREVDSVGPVRHIVSPNKIHHLFLAEWARRWPEARLHAPPGRACWTGSPSASWSRTAPAPETGPPGSWLERWPGCSLAPPGANYARPAT